MHSQRLWPDFFDNLPGNQEDWVLITGAAGRKGGVGHTKIIPGGCQYESEITGRHWWLGVGDGHQHACGWLVLSRPPRTDSRSLLLLLLRLSSPSSVSSKNSPSLVHIYAPRATSCCHHLSVDHICSSFVFDREKKSLQAWVLSKISKSVFWVWARASGLWVLFCVGFCVVS